jgi:hypothetical protein
MFTWTETPLVDMWGQLRYLASPANVFNLLSGKLKSQRTLVFDELDELKLRSYELAACIQQADEYYRAADSVSIVTQPLLQFYGAEALAKAVILANIEDKRLINLRFHGLNTRPSTAPSIAETLKAYSDDPNSWEIEKEFAVTHDGVYPQLCRAVGDTVPPNGTVFYLKELLRVIPDMATRFVRHYSEPSHCFYLSIEPEPDRDGRLRISFSSREDLEGVKRVFPELAAEFEGTTDGFLSRNPMRNLPSFAAFQEGTVAGRYLIRPLECGIRKSMPIMFATLFILGNVVRYKPDLWTRVIEGQASGSIAIVEAFCSLAKRRLPNDTLDAIWNEPFEYGTPARFS